MAGWGKGFAGFVLGVGLCALLAVFAYQKFKANAQLNVSVPTVETADLQDAWAQYYAAVDEVRTNFEASPAFNIDDAHRAGAYQLLQAIIAGNMNGVMAGGDGS